MAWCLAWVCVPAKPLGRQDGLLCSCHGASSIRSSGSADPLFRCCPVTPKGSLLESLCALSLLACISKLQLIWIHSCFVLVCSSTQMALFHPYFLPPFFPALVLRVFLDHSRVPSWLLFCHTKGAELFSSPLKRQCFLFHISPFISCSSFWSGADPAP